MKNSDIPWYNLPKFKLTKNGVESLDDVELLSILFWDNTKEDNSLEISNRILKKYKLDEIEHLGYRELVNFICKGKRADHPDFMKVMKLQSLIELSKRHNRLKNKGYKRYIRSAKDVYDYFIDKYGSKKKEYLLCLYLDTKNKVIKEKVISIGTLDSSLVHPREVFKEAIKESANSIILVHNHPSGDSKPSTDDRRITNRLKKIGELFDIKLSDHIIIGDQHKRNYYSFREANLLD
ncbi:MAG: DNA repair protein RadC [Candidatus Woesearchaeota archaeon]